MRLLEEDEDETMHSGADVEAFQAALNRDIGGDVYSSQPSDSVADCQVARSVYHIASNTCACVESFPTFFKLVDAVEDRKL
ncbi:hypothetical protein OIU78_016235 [Salix suchowensis]|nr:hypothetical protein OIU78_016235 [Salix suchowensis]